MDAYSTLRQGMIGAWCPSLGAQTVMVDRGPYRNNGTLVGAPQYVAVQDGQALQFNGTNQRADVTLPSITTNRFTIHGWARSNTLSPFYPFVLSRAAGMSAGAGVLHSNAANLVSMWNGTISEYTASSGLTITAGVWFRFAMVVNGPTITTWMNNSSFSVSITDTSRNVGGTWWFGYDNVPRWTACAVDDVRFWARALTNSELGLLYLGRRVGLAPSRGVATKFPTTMYQRIAGVWTPTTPQIKVAGVWKPASPSIKAGGVWR